MAYPLSNLVYRPHHSVIPLLRQSIRSSKLYFCTYTSVTTSVHAKSHLPAELGDNSGRNSRLSELRMFILTIRCMSKKRIRLEIRLSEEEAHIFQNKAESYGGNVSAMVRDAVRRFDDKRTRGKLMAMEGLLQYYKKYQQQLSWLGGNFNQCLHRANELAIADELNESYFRSVIMPEVQTAVQTIRGIKAELDAMHDILERT